MEVRMEVKRERGLKQLPDGRWQWSYKDPEGHYYRHIARTKTEARVYLEKVHTQIREGRFLDRKKEGKTKFEVAVKRFLEWSTLHMRINGQQTDIWASRFWLASRYFKGKSLDKISGGDAERFRQELALIPRKRKRGGLKRLPSGKWQVTWSIKGKYHRHVVATEEDARKKLDKALAGITEKELLSRKALDEVVGRLKRLFNLCIEWGLCEYNPAGRIKLFRVDDRRYRYLTQEEEEALLEVCTPYLKRVVLFALHTGMRKGEILGLRWTDVDFPNSVAIVPASRAKSKKDRCIPLNSVALGLIDELPRPIDREAYIFGNTAAGKQENIKRYWNAALAIAGIENFHFHDLRHTYASRLVTAGVDLAVLRELLGHADFAMTLRYAHLHPSRLREAVAILEPKLQLSCNRADSNLRPVSEASVTT
jgi:integrase